MGDQYIVSKRVGCIAVMDTTKADNKTPGLHHNTLGVVKFWQGVWENDQWNVPERYAKEAQELCNQLNAGSQTLGGRTDGI
jgi:hypothetical protein